MSNNWEFFTEKEMRCEGTGGCEMNEEFMSKLIELRKKFNEPMIITSGYRHPAYNMVIGGAPNSPHMKGRAVDVSIMGKEAVRLVRLALERIAKRILDRGYGAISNVSRIFNMCSRTCDCLLLWLLSNKG